MSGIIFLFFSCLLAFPAEVALLAGGLSLLVLTTIVIFCHSFIICFGLLNSTCWEKSLLKDNSKVNCRLKQRNQTTKIIQQKNTARDIIINFKDNEITTNL